MQTEIQGGEARCPRLASWLLASPARDPKWPAPELMPSASPHSTTTNRNNISTSFGPGSSMELSFGLPLLLRSFWKFRDGKPMKPLTHLRARQIVAASNVNFSCHHLPSAPQTFLKCQLILWSPGRTVPHSFSHTHKHMPNPCLQGTHSHQESLFFLTASCSLWDPSSLTRDRT